MVLIGDQLKDIDASKMVSVGDQFKDINISNSVSALKDFLPAYPRLSHPEV